MSDSVASVAALAQRILAAAPPDRRCLIAIAGAPASGKSTLADALCGHLTGLGHASAVVPMDGFHLDNRLLESRGLVPRKGAPETFDLGGLHRLVAALHSGDEVIYPLFDRTRDLSVAAAGHVGADTRLVLVEGNYLLFDEPGWRDLAPLWDITVRVHVPADELRRRLVARWRDHGLSAQAALARAEDNDLPNAERVNGAALAADIDYQGETQ